MDRRFFRGRPATVDSLVPSEKVVTSDKGGLVVFNGSLVLGHKPARPGIGTLGAHEPADVLFRCVLVPADVRRLLVIEVEGDVRLLLGKVLIERFACLGFSGRGAEPDPRRPSVRGDDPAVQRIVPGSAVQGVRCVEDLIVLEIGRLVTSFVWHISAPLRPQPVTGAVPMAGRPVSARRPPAGGPAPRMPGPSPLPARFSSRAPCTRT